MSNIIELNVAPCFASLMGATPVTVAAILEQLENDESHMSSGDCGNFSYMTILEVTRMRLSLASTFFGPESGAAKAVLRDMCFKFYMASKFDNANEWAQVVTCFEMLDEGSSAQSQCFEYVQEARQHLATVT
ncbi:MAG: hypothetical protein WC028_30855 [Candidatus Obscuribacterales bacterium]|jgi:hypothetical protein